MARQNTSHNARTMLDMAAEIQAAADSVRAVAERMKKEKVEDRLSLAHQCTIDDGLSAIKKWCREANGKIDDVLDSRRRF